MCVSTLMLTRDRHFFTGFCTQQFRLKYSNIMVADFGHVAQRAIAQQQGDIATSLAYFPSLSRLFSVAVLPIFCRYLVFFCRCLAFFLSLSPLSFAIYLVYFFTLQLSCPIYVALSHTDRAKCPKLSTILIAETKGTSI